VKQEDEMVPVSQDEIPVRLVNLKNALRSLIPYKAAFESAEWPARFLAAARQSSDLSGVWHAWVTWSLTDQDYGVIRHASGYPEVESAIQRVVELWRTGGTLRQFALAAESAADASEDAWAGDPSPATRAAAWAAKAASWASRSADVADAVVDVAETAWSAWEEVTWATNGAAAWTTAARDKLVSLMTSARESEMKP
jgi:hypothetical protein